MVTPNTLVLNSLTAGANVKFKVGYSWQTGTKIYDNIFKLKVPRFPKEISKADVRARKINHSLVVGTQAGATNKTIIKYKFNVKTRELWLALDKGVPLTGLQVKDIIKITATGGSQLAVINQELKSIAELTPVTRTTNSNYNVIKIMIPRTFNLTNTPNYVSLTGTNTLIEFTQTKPQNSYLCYIVDKGVTNNLIFTDYFRIVPIFAYSIMDAKSAWSDKIIMTTTTTVTDTSPPAWTSLPGTYNCSIPIRQTQVITSDSAKPSLKFYVAIAKYYRDDTSDPWTAEWFQKDGGKPIWKLANYVGDV